MCIRDRVNAASPKIAFRNSMLLLPAGDLICKRAATPRCGVPAFKARPVWAFLYNKRTALESVALVTENI